MKQRAKQIIVRILTWEARAILWRYKPRIAAVTGSVGKTSTKDAIATVLASTYRVWKSQKSYNSELGVPLTILNRPSGWSNPVSWLVTIVKGALMVIWPVRYPEWLVLEVGADRPGDISAITRWLKPDIAVVTRISQTPVHIEFFASREQIIEEKSQLVRAVKKDGTVVLNYDDQDVQAFARRAPGSVLFYGFHSQAHVFASNESVTYEALNGVEMPSGISVKANTSGSCVPISLTGVLGLQHIYPVLAAVAVGVSQRINLITISQAFAHHTPPPGRMNLLPGIKQSLIIDDSYNASPVAVREALRTLNEISVPNRRIALLGDMRELGEHSSAEHRAIGEQAASVCDLLFTVGDGAREIASEARRSGMAEDAVRSFDDAQTAGKELELLLAAGDIVLVKGSQAVRCEKAVKEIMAEPMRAGELLVRQGKEWE
ncbi:MAG: UDP-N-acetylmuramoyl-tripeptide--D-alanyl-D-alanine ligase [Candidatus Paceibacterota bacterium]